MKTIAALNIKYDWEWLEIPMYLHRPSLRFGSIGGIYPNGYIDPTAAALSFPRSFAALLASSNWYGITYYSNGANKTSKDAGEIPLEGPRFQSTQRKLENQGLYVILKLSVV